MTTWAGCRLQYLCSPSLHGKHCVGTQKRGTDNAPQTKVARRCLVFVLKRVLGNVHMCRQAKAAKVSLIWRCAIVNLPYSLEALSRNAMGF